ncbi:MAG: DUF2029 domain-containing protein, partial [Spirochaetota bacterium]|nr:DUF2029 domain-containing protein [Spirochaetota bacterium]
MDITSNKKMIFKILLIFSILVSLIAFGTDFKNTFQYGGVDFRDRVCSARAYKMGLNPYNYKSYNFKGRQADLLFHPLEYLPEIPVSRINAPPTVLILFLPFADISYKTQRIIWFFIQWGMLILSLILLHLCTDNGEKRYIIWILGLLFISGNYFWHFHVERGQIYILYSFLIILAYWVLQKSFSFKSFLSGFILGFVASLRPPIILMGIPIIIGKDWKMLAGGVFGLLFGFTLTIIFADISLWEKYYSALPWQIKINFGELKM